MAKFQNRYRIEPNRLQYWDYSASGQYFLTVCIDDFQCILGDVVNDAMVLSPAGELVKSEIKQIPTYHPRIILDEWIIMPNHIHLIVELTEYDIPAVEKIHEFSLQSQQRQPQSMQWWHNPTHTPTTDDIKQYRKYR